MHFLLVDANPTELGESFAHFCMFRCPTYFEHDAQVDDCGGQVLSGSVGGKGVLKHVAGSIIALGAGTTNADPGGKQYEEFERRLGAGVEFPSTSDFWEGRGDILAVFHDFES